MIAPWLFASPRKLVLFLPNLNLTILIDKATLNVFNYIKKEKKTYIRTLYVRNHQYAPRVWSLNS